MFNHPEHLSRSPHRLGGGHCLGLWDTLQDAGEEHLGIVENLLWDVKWREWKPGKGAIKVVWEGGSVENREKRGQKRLVMCKQLLASTLVWSCPLPDMYNLSCSLSKLHFWVTGYSVWMCTYGGPSASYWREDHGSEDLCIHGAGRCSIWGCARQCVITREYHKLD